MKHHHCFLLLTFLLTFSLAHSQEVKTDSIQNKEKKGSQAVMLFRYYYYPNLQTYYDTQDDIYLYKQNNEWLKKKQLSGNAKGYSMSNNVYVLIKEYTGDTPYLYIDQHKKDFPPNFKSRKPHAAPQKSKFH